LLIFFSFQITASMQLDISIFDRRVWDRYVEFFFNPTNASTMVQLSFRLLVSLLYAEISENLGQNVLLNFFTGKYHFIFIGSYNFLAVHILSFIKIAKCRNKFNLSLQNLFTSNPCYAIKLFLNSPAYKGIKIWECCVDRFVYLLRELYGQKVFLRKDQIIKLWPSINY
jgi:hypothetical protein